MDTMPCQLTEDQIRHIVFGLIKSTRPNRWSLWLRRGIPRSQRSSSSLTSRGRLASYWHRRIAADPSLAQVACTHWAAMTASLGGATPAQPSSTGGPGTELKKRLRWLGIVPTPNCSCNARAALMDANGPDWCAANMETIIGWLAEEAHNRHLPFVTAPARIIIQRSIKADRKSLLQTSGTTPAPAVQ